MIKSVELLEGLDGWQLIPGEELRVASPLREIIAHVHYSTMQSGKISVVVVLSRIDDPMRVQTFTCDQVRFSWQVNATIRGMLALAAQPIEIIDYIGDFGEVDWYGWTTEATKPDTRTTYVESEHLKDPVLTLYRGGNATAAELTHALDAYIGREVEDEIL